MAYSKDGLLGNFRGRLSNFVVYEREGKTVIRSLPSVKRAPAQGAEKANQGSFSVVMKIMQSVKPFIKWGFYNVAQGRSAFHTAMSVNLQQRKLSDNPSDLRWLILSQGERAGALQAGFSIQGQKAIIEWQKPQAGKPWAEDDQVMLLAINTKTLDTTHYPNAALRSMHKAEIGLPAFESEGQILVFIAFKDPMDVSAKKDITKTSDSQTLEMKQ